MTGTTKFCRDCQHRADYVVPSISECTTPALGKNHVTGEQNRAFCSSMRLSHILNFPICGPSGLLFEQRIVPEPPPLDLDAMADAARARLARFIDTRARQVHSQVEEGFYKARLDFDVSRQVYTWLHGADSGKPFIEVGVDTSKFFPNMDKARDAVKAYITSSQRVTGSKGFLHPFPLTGLL